ncbi:hypothetical protein HMPREF9071_0674 [Capnocytophaga sp. oral taxon 338 str. F0234]|nr:hypothetical protein HMPREF9071_0674 [Capnocytophaga sp. oral taxon 338 str. F0234]
MGEKIHFSLFTYETLQTVCTRWLYYSFFTFHFSLFIFHYSLMRLSKLWALAGYTFHFSLFIFHFSFYFVHLPPNYL